MSLKIILIRDAMRNTAADVFPLAVTQFCGHELQEDKGRSREPGNYSIERI